VTDIATRNNFPKKYLGTILLELRNNGFLRSKKGPNGGYALSRPADEIMIGRSSAPSTGRSRRSASPAGPHSRPATIAATLPHARSGFP
jgi:hypothetical protein